MVLLDVALLDTRCKFPTQCSESYCSTHCLPRPWVVERWLDVVVQVVVALTADVLHDALLVQLVGVPDVVLLHVGLFDVVTLASCCSPVCCRTHCTSTSWRFSTPGCS